MPKKKKVDKNNKIDNDEIIIGYNTNKKNQKISKKKKKSKKENSQEKVISINVPKGKTKKKKKKKNKKLRKLLKAILRLLIIIAILASIILFLFVSPVFNIKEIEVSGMQKITKDKYIEMSGIELESNIFMTDKQEAIIKIKEEPYVQSVQINFAYPSKVEINVEEREINYVAEQNGKYFYIDKNGYILEIKDSLLDFLILKGYTTNLEELEIGQRIGEKDLEKFNELIKILDAIENNNIEVKLTSINIRR